VAAEKPTWTNIVVLFADDLGYGDLSCYGHPTIRTPQLDNMAAEGIRLTSFYVAAPACTPSRVALLTGRYPVRVGLPHVLGPDSENGIPESEITLAEALKEEGYRTAAIGKWHLGHARQEFLPTSNGFDQYFGLLYSNDMIPPWVQTEKPLELWRGQQPVEQPVDQSTLTDRYTDEALQFISQNQNRPFFLYLPYSMPHVPLSVSESRAGKSLAGLYGDVIESIDWSAGKILAALKTAGLDENTIVVFTSDNGPWLNMPPRMFGEGIVDPWDAGSPGPFRGAKGTTYEGGFRVPAIVRWPGKIPAGQVSTDVITAMDLYVTLLAIGGGKTPSDRVIDGNNILSVLQEGQASPTREFCYFQGSRLEALRIGKWKLRVAGRTASRLGDDEPTAELFDLEIDPSERYNVADLHPGLVTELRQRMVHLIDQFEGMNQ
jgi:arylsulfatase A-like enzyme